MSESSRTLVTSALMRALRLIILAVAVVSMLVFALPLLVVNAALYSSMAQQVVAFALLMSVAVVAGVQVLGDRPVGGVRWVLVAVVFTAAGLATTGIPTEHLMAEAEWSYGEIGWFLLLVLIDRGTVATAVALGMYTAGSFVQLVMVGQGQEVADLAVVTTVVLGCELLVLAIAMALRRIAASAVRAAELAERARTADAIAERLHADRRARYADLATTIVPLLTDLTTGAANLSDDAVRANYAVAAARMRRLFAEHDEAVDPLLHELRACLDLADRNGVAVYLGTIGEHPPPPLVVRRALTEPAMRVIAAARSEVRVTVLGSPAGVTVSVLADAAATEPEPRAGDHVGIRVTRLVDGPKVWLEATWPAPN
ncbi:MAG TPA: hypothetical protein VFV67_17210 [Actinophytocola sp.]|uniref:hypothetical protein n=1 Tax=Actinophytocola sp. TaxID=1872138 RepID=UPI002DB8607F|nr:hypothetical protein [Actinophytocola sp.]HEU5472394.1 hypothetical protein [Actinophytocola sp.]